MTTLQEAAMRKALEALEAPTPGALTGSAESWSIWYDKRFIAMEELRTALAQQELPQKTRPDFMAGYDAGMADAKRMAQQAANKNCPQPEICGSKECEFCRDTAAPAPQAQECTRSHPHELMDGYCELRTEIARLTNENARLKAAPQPAQGEPAGCACRWDADDNRVATCARHQGWLDVVHEWAERAKAAEKAREE